jgi:hypothetical protein
MDRVPSVYWFEVYFNGVVASLDPNSKVSIRERAPIQRGIQALDH